MCPTLVAAVGLLSILGSISTFPLPSETKYNNRYDRLDIDAILNNQRTLNSYIKCLLDQGSCTAEGRTLKEHITEAMETSCEKCTDTQKKLMRKATKFLIENRPEDWKNIQEYYDKEGKFDGFIEDFVNSDD
uniref:Chemosensory protein n=1 Tax=Timema monikensis TaxID=170555 RepID=A0A7R9HNJ4_9NEOP|nr:unnamed protein product [Timema monikensis]